MPDTHWRGHVQVAFELRTGRTLKDWLLEHGPTMSRLAASEAIGFAPGSTAGLRAFVKQHMPPGFEFKAFVPTFTDEQLEAAWRRKQKGEIWREIALDYGHSEAALRECSRRYRRAKSKAAGDGQQPQPGNLPGWPAPVPQGA